MQTSNPKLAQTLRINYDKKYPVYTGRINPAISVRARFLSTTIHSPSHHKPYQRNYSKTLKRTIILDEGKKERDIAFHTESTEFHRVLRFPVSAFHGFFSIRTANYPVAGRVLHCRYRSVLLGPVAFPPIRWREVKPKTHELKDDDPRVGRTETTSRPHIEIRIKRTMYRHPYIYWVVGMNRYTE